MIILAIDPGTEKCGVALVDGNGSVLSRRIVTVRELQSFVREVLRLWQKVEAVIGKGTGSKTASRVVGDVLREHGMCPQFITERNTTLQARELYFELNPARGWRRLLPRGLRLPPEPYDDLAAVIIARRYLESLGKYREG